METTEFVPSIREFCWYCLRKWKGMLIFAVICGILAGGFMFVKGYTSLDEKKAQYKIDMDKYEQDMELYNSRVDALNAQKASYQATLTELNDYINNSDFMNLDPNNTNYCFRNVIINANYGSAVDESVDSSDYAAVDLYNQFITNPADINAVAEAGNVSVESVADMIFTEVMPDSNLISIRVYNADADGAWAMSTEIINQANESYATISEQVGTIDCILAFDALRENQSSYSGEVNGRQEGYLEKVAYYQEKITDINNSVDELKCPTAIKEVSNSSEIINIIMSILLGAVVGLILYILIQYLRFYSSGSLLSVSYIKSLFLDKCLFSYGVYKNQGFSNVIINKLLGPNISDIYSNIEKSLIFLGYDSSFELVIFIEDSTINDFIYEYIDKKKYNVKIINDFSCIQNITGKMLFIVNYTNINHDTVLMINSIAKKKDCFTLIV